MIVWRPLSHSSLRPVQLSLRTRRWICASSLARRLHEPVQVYVSTSSDPYINLSIEHYLFQKSSQESFILFQYVNRPSIILGRNQNPWLEVNLAQLQQPNAEIASQNSHLLGAIDLIRRRSGGGTVFHDEGNVNWTVICPSGQFTRDKHVEMIVRALRNRGMDRARVNVRHDIVLDQGERVMDATPHDTHMSPYAQSGDLSGLPLKVSGSAYKLTRGRALHHGTCLLGSPNLHAIPHYLHSPAKPFISARGVESVSSPVGNIMLENEDFCTSVQDEFIAQYGESQRGRVEHLGDDLAEVEYVADGIKELKSLEWLYLQTPQFTISNSSDLSRKFDVEMSVRHGIITGGHVMLHGHNNEPAALVKLDSALAGQRLHEIPSWENILQPHLLDTESAHASAVHKWLQSTLPVPQLPAA